MARLHRDIFDDLLVHDRECDDETHAELVRLSSLTQHDGIQELLQRVAAEFEREPEPKDR